MFRLSQLTGFNTHKPLPAGVMLDLDAAQGVIKNGSNKVSTWFDSSNHGNDAVQASSGKQPTWTSNIFNNRPAILFDGFSSAMDITKTIFSRNYTTHATIFVVVKKESTQNDIRRLFEGHANTYDYEMGIGLGADSIYALANVPVALSGKAGIQAQNSIANSTTSAGDKMILVGTWSGFTVQLWKNGTASSAITLNSTIQSANSNSKGWAIGCLKENGSYNYYTNASLGRLIMWNRKLADSEVALLMQQFANDYL